MPISLLSCKRDEGQLQQKRATTLTKSRPTTGGILPSRRKQNGQNVIVYLARVDDRTGLDHGHTTPVFDYAADVFHGVPHSPAARLDGSFLAEMFRVSTSLAVYDGPSDIVEHS